MTNGNSQRRRPEVLAPAGDREAMRAAVRAGADAVYFGLQGYNARARATNFDAAELAGTLSFLHDHGVKGYVTLNTLVFDAELAGIEAAIRACAAAGVDAVIVQDLGVASLVRAIAPTLPVHASTQMTCTDASSVELAASLGASRVILARELSLDDIRRIKEATDVELEVFVHGALCIAYSGQCMTSEAIGGRSANRGACAQACRLPYELVVDGVLQDLGDRAYLLSPEDLEASSAIAGLVELGVASVKIEGRLKGPEYVAATTLLYRRAIDAAFGVAAPADDQIRGDALQMFSRGSGPGFLHGIDHQRLVEGRACDHRGVLAGVCEGVRVVRGKRHLGIRASATLARGDGILVEGGYASEGELGGRVWSILIDGKDVDHAPPGASSLVWLGPDRAIGHTAGRPSTAHDRTVDRTAGRPSIAADRSVGRASTATDRAGGDSARDLAATPGGVDRDRAARAGAMDDDAYEGRRVWKTNDPVREKAVLASVERDPWRTPVAFRLAGKLGERPVLEATTSRGAHASVVVDAALETADKHPLTRDAIAEKLGKLGDTPFALGSLELDLPPTALLPISALNRARRAVVEALLLVSARAHATTMASHVDLLAHALAPDRAPPPGGLFVLCRTLAQARAAHEAGADGVYLDFLELTGTGAAVRALRALPPRVDHPPLHITVAPPRIRKPGEEKIDKYLLDLAPDAVLVRSLGALYDATSASEPSLHAVARPALVPHIGDFSLNVTNKVTAAEVLRRGLIAFTPSFDLDAAQLTTLLASSFAPFAEVVMHHPMPLFHMEHCVIAALLSEGRDHKTCGRPCETKQVSLRDRAGMDHPVEADVGCRNTVFHAAAQSAAGIVPALRESGVTRFRIELVRETADEVCRIVMQYRALLEGRTTPAALWRALKAEGGYGVVKGSLRVLAS